MDKIKIANDLVKLYADYKYLSQKYGCSIKPEYSEAVAQAILLLKSRGDKNDGNTKFLVRG